VIVLFLVGSIAGASIHALVVLLLGSRAGKMLISVGWVPLAIWTNVLIARL
jgi:hypothetical protein